MNSLPFQIEIQPGSPAYEQVIQAVHRAVAKGILVEGDAFPSVRHLSKIAKINPNTAHKVVQALVVDGTLEVLTGRGSRIAPPLQRNAKQKREIILKDLDELIVEALRIGMDLNDFQTAVREVWQTLDKKKTL